MVKFNSRRMLTRSTQLRRDDPESGSKIVVAKYHRGSRHRLEIAEELVPILSEFVMSFVFFQRRREQGDNKH